MKDWTGERCGKWVVMGPRRKGDKSRGREAAWWCKCDCGANDWVSITSLKTVKGGCRKCQRVDASERHRKHGLSRMPHWLRHYSMVERCHNPKDKSYRYYGGRGVTVCDRWRYGDGERSGFECFVLDMKPPNGSGWSIHRLDSDRGYEPGNCTWISMAEHMKLHGELRKFVPMESAE